jgi:hypothetical protein
MKAVLGAAVLLLLSVVPAAQAQVPASDLTLAIDDLATPIPYSGSGTFAFNLTVGCLGVLRSAGETQNPAPVVTVALSDPPAWASATPTEVLVTPDQSCVGGGDGYMHKTGTIAVTVTKDAPGVTEQTLNFTASMPTQGEPIASTDPALATVAYHASYTLTTDAKFPLTVTSPKTTFNLTVTQSSNARSMVMVEEVHASSGNIAGMASTVYDCGAGKSDSKTFKVTFTAPDGAWNKSTVQFKAYSHFLLLNSKAGPYDPGTPTTWEFVNGGVPATKTDGGGSDHKSPMPVAPLTALGLVAVAAMLRRRA